MLYSLPDQIVDVLEKEMAEFDYAVLERAAHSLHAKYLPQSGSCQLSGIEESMAYALFRMPATYAAIEYVLSKLEEQRPGWQPSSYLDIGCGPGTAFFAMKERYPSLKQGMAIDCNADSLRLFRRLCQALGMKSPELLLQNEPPQRIPITHDVAILSYFLSELKGEEQDGWLHSVSSFCPLLLILEPGTPKGFETILRARRWASTHSFHVLAPCPHSCTCPMEYEKSWCHVRLRLKRPHFQQRLKEGMLGYEDEPLCYLILSSSQDTNMGASRVVSSPQKRSGHVHLTLCHPEGEIKKVVVSKKNRDLYTQAKELCWGDTWPHTCQKE